MEIANNMKGKRMERQVNSLNKDFKTLNSKPQITFFYGDRVRWVEEVEKISRESKKLLRRYDDKMTLCILKQKGYIVINKLNATDYEQIITE
jgi:hypothetical protein